MKELKDYKRELSTQIELEKQNAKTQARNLLRKIMKQEQKNKNSDPSVCYSQELFSKL
jgi:hypothetical protein